MLTLKKGFSLLELILVLAIASSVSFMKFQDLKNEQETVQAKAIGEQIQQIGNAVNGYISIKYDKLSTLTSSESSTSDPGPRTCSSSTNSCTITYQTLINEGLLPTSFNGVNANKSSYSIVLRRSGTSPNYVINGLVTTSTPWIEGNKIRYDLLGQAMENAGVDSGMTKTTSSISGYAGSWSENSADYSNVNKAGLLGYRVGYDSSMYSVYLRRDGTLPMTGNLNMGGNDIDNATNITASGAVSTGTLTTSSDATVGGKLAITGTTTMTGALQVNNTIASSSSITAAGDVNAGNWVTAKNGYGDTISLGGDSSPGGIGPDYEILLGTNKPLTIHSPKASRGSDIILDVDGNTRIQTNFGTNGYNPNDLPSGWVGGVRTFDVVASGTVATLKDGTKGSDSTLAAYMNQNGNIWASGNISSDSTISGKYIIGNDTPTLGASCDTNGIQGHMSSGMPVFCVNKTWQTIGSNIRIVTNNATNADWVAAHCNSDEVVVGGGGTSYGGPVGFTNTDGQDVAPGMDASTPLSDLSGWKVSGMNQSPGDTLTVYAICMKKY